MDTPESNEAIREYLISNYESLIQEINPLLEQKVELLKTYPHLNNDICDQFRFVVGSILIQKINTDCPEIPAEDVIVFIRSLDVSHFCTLGITNL